MDAAECVARLDDAPRRARAQRVEGRAPGPVDAGEAEQVERAARRRLPPGLLRREPARAARAGRGGRGRPRPPSRRRGRHRRRWWRDSRPSAGAAPPGSPRRSGRARGRPPRRAARSRAGAWPRRAPRRRRRRARRGSRRAPRRRARCRWRRTRLGGRRLQRPRRNSRGRRPGACRSCRAFAGPARRRRQALARGGSGFKKKRLHKRITFL